MKNVFVQVAVVFGMLALGHSVAHAKTNEVLSQDKTVYAEAGGKGFTKFQSSFASFDWIPKMPQYTWASGWFQVDDATTLSFNLVYAKRVDADSIYGAWDVYLNDKLVCDKCGGTVAGLSQKEGNFYKMQVGTNNWFVGEITHSDIVW